MRSSIVAVLLVIGVTNANTKKILTVGDSYSEYSGDTFSLYCDGATQAPCVEHPDPT